MKSNEIKRYFGSSDVAEINDTKSSIDYDQTCFRRSR